MNFLSLKKYSWVRLAIIAFILWLGLMLSGAGAVTNANIYEQRTLHSPDGIGKFYMGREIAQVMGHLGASWLERPSREWEEQPALLVENLGLKPTDVVADIGAGTGYISLMIAQKIPQGKVLAVDVQPEMREILENFKKRYNFKNVQTILGTESNPNLPENSVDLAIMVDAYHEFAYPREMMEGIVRALKPNGRVVLVEYRRENPFIAIKPLHKMTQKQVKKEMTAVGLNWKQTIGTLPQQHILIFNKNPYPKQKTPSVTSVPSSLTSV